MRSINTDERGSALVFAALALAFLMTAGALAVDAGSLYTAHGDAQKAADAAALAGASAFVDAGDASAATDRAMEYATRNAIRGEAIQENEVDVRVVAESAKVAVTITRPGVPLWFARLIGRNSATVVAHAAAATTPGDEARCVKPFAVADLWHDDNEDGNHNGLPDNGELWVYGDDSGDYYEPAHGNRSHEHPATGYGTSARGGSRDQGRQVILREEHGQRDQTTFYTWVMPTDESMNDSCRWTANGADHSANALRANICNCNMTKIGTEQTYQVDNGGRNGPVHQGISELIASDPGARWDETTKRVTGSSFSPWTDSPRIVTIPLFSPADPAEPDGSVRFVAFAMIFIEGQDHINDPITGRFVNIVRDVRLID